MEKKGNILMQRYELGRFLGQGNFAKVYYARDIKSGQSVAIKVVDKDKVLKAALNEQLKREISVMMLVKHPNVLQLFEVMATKTKIYIVLEYAKGGELFNKVVKGRLKEDIARWIFQQLISAVDCCHKRGVYHRDLKLENLLLDEAGNLKVSDFGLSAVVESKHQDGFLHTVCGTPTYVAPEVIMRKGYDGAKSDIWSCGVILYSMLAGHLPFYDTNLMEVYRKIRKAEYKCPNWFPPEVRKLLAKILDPNPDTRMSIEKIMENPWFKKGLGIRPVRHKQLLETKETSQPDVAGAVCGDSTEQKRIAAESKLEMGNVTNLNAFDLISLSTGFDLSGLFVENSQKSNLSFTSQQPASVIISKVEDIARNLKLKVMKKGGGSVKLAESEEGRKEALAVRIDVEILEFTPSFYLVELKQSAGDTFEFQKILKQGIKPALEDIVWAWQGEQRQEYPIEL